MAEAIVSNRVVHQRLRNRIMEPLGWLSEGPAGVHHMGAHEWFEQFFDWYDNRLGAFENDAMTSEEASAFLRVHALMRAACDATSRQVTDDELLASGWVEKVAPAARDVLDLMQARGRFSEEAEEVEPGRPA